MNRKPALDQLCSYENLFWAWHKVVVFCQATDTWYDEAEFRAYELNLRENLLRLAEDFSTSKYQNTPLRPLPQPKREADGSSSIRQAFWVPIRDQVAWLAYVNIVGPELDGAMPPWSYGHRLYRSLTYERASGKLKARTIVGPHRNSRGLTYRRWAQSWPLFRRHALLTAKQMSKARFALPETEQRVLDAEEGLEVSLRLPYLNAEYWRRPVKKLYWGSFDIAKFYPSIPLNLVKAVLMKRSLMAQQIGPEVLTALTSFPVDLEGWSSADLNTISLGKNDTLCPFVPTGLSVAGFLANVAMLPVDDWVSREAPRRQIAHFRYVDDHLILAGRFSHLEEWLNDYRDILDVETGCELNEEKTEPEALRKYLQSSKGRTNARRAASLDPEFPSPLMTETLAKISDLSRLDFNLLDPGNQRRVLHDLHHLLVTDFPDDEVAEKTRVSFAATLIARLTPKLQLLDSELMNLVPKRGTLASAAEEAQASLRSFQSHSKAFGAQVKRVNLIQRELRFVSKRLRMLQRAWKSLRDQQNARALAVLRRAVKLHPEKLRLWQRTLDFLRETGQSVESITNLVGDLEKRNPLGAVLIRSQIRQVVSHHCLTAARDWFSPDLSPEERKSALKYLTAAARLPQLLSFQNAYYYERNAQRAFECSLAVSVDAVASQKATEGLITEWKVFRKQCKRPSLSRLRLSPPEVWWLSLELFTRDISQHSAILQHAAARLSPTEIPSWRVWTLLNIPVPSSALKKLARSPSATEHGDEGWLLDAFAFRREDFVRLRRSQNREVRKIARVIRRERRDWLLLPEWIRWTSHLERDPNDPRLSEWTALELTCLVAEAVEALPAKVRRIAATSSFNFLIPRALADESALFGWETWRNQLAKWGEIRVRRRNIIYDSRTDPGVEDFSEIDFEFGSVRSLGMVLLSLIRRDFRLPLVRGSAAVSGTVSRIAIRQIQDKPCSSRTMAVLEACLMDRSTETFMLLKRGVDKDELDADTANDVPLINTIQELKREIRICQEILVRHQSTVAAHRPRQLIPLYLGQYNRKNWQEAGIEEAPGDAI